MSEYPICWLTVRLNNFAPVQKVEDQTPSSSLSWCYKLHF